MSIHTFIKIGLTVMTIGGLIMFTLNSCGTRNGYGCKGNQSWNQMVKRNNRP
jgi:hypothetical protein